MKTSVKDILRPFVPLFLLKGLRKQRENKILKEWEKQGKPVPAPHLVKQLTIKEYQKKYNNNILVETGTFLGEMVEAQKTVFKKVFSIELGIDLYKQVVERFKNDKNVILVQGDSGKVLPQILADIHEPAIFWLDGHYSAGITAKGDKECPIFEEIDAIFNSKKLNHILLVDDARCFTGEGDYPTIEKLTKYVKSKNNDYKAEVKNDIIRYTI